MKTNPFKTAKTDLAGKEVDREYSEQRKIWFYGQTIRLYPSDSGIFTV